MEIETFPGGLRVRAPGKLNLYLEVGAPRADGFHDIDSLFQAISFCDVLELRSARDGEVALEEKGMADGTENLVYRAAIALRDRFLPTGSPHGARILLDKRIPRGAGLGGGSSDAAAALVGLARLWNLRISFSELSALALELGSDVPFFLHGGTARCRGRGEKVTSYGDVFDRAPPFHYVLVCPGVHAPTGAVYEALDRVRDPGFTLTPPSPLDSINPSDLFSRLARGDVIFNRLEGVSSKLFPELVDVSSRMRAEPFLAVSMTGSGSGFYGLCSSVEEAAELAGRLRGDFSPEVEVLWVRSLPSSRFPWLSDLSD